jgi:hypothetical protein
MNLFIPTGDENPDFIGKWLMLAIKNISHLSGANAISSLFFTILIFPMNGRQNLCPINVHGNTAVKNAING